MHYGKWTKCQDCIKQYVQLCAVKNDVIVSYLGVNVSFIKIKGKIDVHNSCLHSQGMQQPMLTGVQLYISFYMITNNTLCGYHCLCKYLTSHHQGQMG